MPRRPHPPHTRRSEHWLRVAVNQRTDLLDGLVERAFRLPADDRIEWLSPVELDGFCEYYDESFLERLREPMRSPLSEFWPASGPRWDGLARTGSGKIILVEAKAYVEEAVDFRSKAGEASRKRISAALAATKQAFRAAPVAHWEEPFYQYANRLAHLYYLRTLNRSNAYLLFICFANAPDVPNPTTVEEWHGAIRIIERSLGLGAHPYRGYLNHIVLSVPELLSNSSIERTSSGRPRLPTAAAHVER